ncbi:hypothetical protein BZA70DRAFT_179667 [Myxozyma melibiosi]|uniref:ML-like domain-containing protein n=1 Tax=Myxozyma melibiosi TaxID=54550 RepID=A0ABR1F493_9ASCO
MLSPLLLLLLVLLAVPARSASVPFESCLSETVARSGTYFVPSSVDALYDDGLGQVNISVVGDMYGSLPDYSTDTNRLTTLRTSASVMQYRVDNTYTRFCSYVSDGDCPFGPSSNASFYSSYLLGSSYYFVSVTSEVSIIDPSVDADVVACISATITPTFRSSTFDILVYVPVGILVLLAVSIVVSAIYNPWTGTKDFYSWSSNYGQDPNALRLVTPGFGDLLQYIQFAFLLASLNLSFPGFYQPAMSASSWASLQFNTSFASHHSRDIGIDNIYAVDGEYGMSNLAQLVGLGKDWDIWTCFVVWLLAVTGIVLLVSQSLYGFKWLICKFKGHHSVDLRSKNIPSILGMLVRLYMIYFSLPLVSFSCFQLLRAADSPVYISVLAGVLLVLWIVAALLLVRVIRQARPQQALYDDLPTLLCIGPLYNTYRERGFMFCIVQILATLIRGIFVGAVQPSGTAQITVLLVVEAVYLVFLSVFRPFHHVTKMNIYHAIISVARFITIVFSICFISSLGLSDTVKGWVAYAILLIHALVLVFVFFLHAVQAIVETIARLAGVTSDPSTTFVRAFGLRQLARRRHPQEKFGTTGNLDLEATRSLAVSPDEQSLAVSPRDYSFSLQPSMSGNILDSLPMPLSAGGMATLSPDSSKLGKPVSPVSPNALFAYYRMPRRPRLRSSSDGRSPALTNEDGSKTPVSPGEIQASSNSSQIKGADPLAWTSSSREAGSSTGERESWYDAETMEDDGLWSDQYSMAQPTRNVDYAVRESDVYLNMRKQQQQQQQQQGLAKTSTLGNSSSSGEPVGIAISGLDTFPLHADDDRDDPEAAAQLDPDQPKSAVSAKSRTPLSARAKYTRKLGTGPADPTGVGAGVRGWFSKRIEGAAERLHVGNRNRGFVVVRNAPLRTLTAFDEERVAPAAAVQSISTVDASELTAPGPSRSTSAHIVVDQAVPKNTFTPIIKSPVPPAVRRQQQQQQQQQQQRNLQKSFTEPLPYAPISGIPTQPSPTVPSPSDTEEQSRLLHGPDGDISSSSLVGEVRSMRVGDMIRSTRYVAVNETDGEAVEGAPQLEIEEN